jgi:hypothetical protein
MAYFETQGLTLLYRVQSKSNDKFFKYTVEIRLTYLLNILRK